MISILRPLPLSALAGAAFVMAAALPAAAQDSAPWRGEPARGYGGAPDYADTYSGGRRESGTPRSDAYAPQSQDGYGSSGDAYAPTRGGYSAGGGADAPTRGGYGGDDAYSPTRERYRETYADPGTDAGGYGEPYAPPPGAGGYPEPMPPPDERHYNQNEIVQAGHGFFGAISQNLAAAVEYAFKSQGRPNGYILGEDAGGAFVVGLRYGEGRLYTKDAGEHKVFWQGPSLGYDAGAEGSKAMVLVYNLRDPSEIYNRFGGVQGAAYLIGGVSVQFQKYGDVTLAVIRSGVGVRLGANVGYLKYTRTPTWNPL